MTIKKKDQPQRIGLIGSGLLGAAIAGRLRKCHHEISLHDSNELLGKAMAATLGTWCPTASEVFASSDLVVLCLPTSAVVQQVLNESSAALREGHTILDATTGDPSETEAIASELNKKNVNYIEVRVAGSSQQLGKGEAVLFLGGAEPVVTDYTPILESLAAKRFYLGAVGNASRFKLVHNLILGLNRAVLAEGLEFSRSLGFEPGETLNILEQTPAVSGVMKTKGPRMVLGRYDAQATLSQHLKDVRMILAEAEGSGAAVPLSSVHRELLEKAEQLGFGSSDNSAIIEALRQRPPAAE